MSLSHIFTVSWKNLFKSKKSFGIILFFQVLPTIVLLFGAVCLSFCAKYVIPFLGIDLENMTFLARFTTPGWVAIIAIMVLLLILVWLTFQLICSYLSSLALSWNFKNKSYTLKTILKSWRGMWTWAGTGLAVGVQLIGIFVVGFILALGFAYFHEYLALIPVAFTVGTFIFFSLSLSFSLPVYFFEGKKYFQATKASRALVYGRWWKTFGYALSIIAGAVGVSMIFVIIEMFGTSIIHFLSPSLLSSHTFGLFLSIATFLYYFIQMFCNTVVQIFIQSFTFTLYQSYSSSIIAKKSKK